jgi:hypothetical protein
MLGALFGVGADRAAANGPSLVIDAGVSGNQAASVGSIENCIAVQKNDEFQMDLVIQNVTKLLAWDLYVQYDPSVLVVVDQNDKLFQAANAGSSVIDLAARVPDDSGLHELAAVDTSDPPTPDTGTGVLARVTFRAVGTGTSPVGFGKLDLDSNGILDKGTLLRDTDNNLIGDTNGDTFFDGPQTGSTVVVGGDCPPGSVVATAPPQADSGGGSFPWLIVSGSVAAALVLLGGGLAVLFYRRQAARRGLPGETN